MIEDCASVCAVWRMKATASLPRFADPTTQSARRDTGCKHGCAHTSFARCCFVWRCTGRQRCCWRAATASIRPLLCEFKVANPLLQTRDGLLISSVLPVSYLDIVNSVVLLCASYLVPAPSTRLRIPSKHDRMGNSLHRTLSDYNALRTHHSSQINIITEKKNRITVEQY